MDVGETKISELLLQSLEHINGEVLILEAAIKSAIDHDLSKKWKRRLAESTDAIRILRDACLVLNVDPDRFTRGRREVQDLAWALIAIVEKTSVEGPSATAQLTACECLAVSETKGSLNRELIGKCAEKLDGEQKAALKKAYYALEGDKAETLHHLKEWCRGPGEISRVMDISPLSATGGNNPGRAINGGAEGFMLLMRRAVDRVWYA